MRIRQSVASCCSALLLCAALPALAADGAVIVDREPEREVFQFGDDATALAEINVRTGPHISHHVSEVLQPGEAVEVGSCTDDGVWCHVQFVRDMRLGGWVAAEYLSRVPIEGSLFRGPQFDRGRGGPGEVCFYTDRDYSGQAHCFRSGQVFHDLEDWGISDDISSISVTGDVSALVCRDPEFESYCVMFVHSEDRLERFLENEISSIRVY